MKGIIHTILFIIMLPTLVIAAETCQLNNDNNGCTSYSGCEYSIGSCEQCDKGLYNDGTTANITQKATELISEFGDLE